MAYYPNKDDFEEKFWKRNYRVLLTDQAIEFFVNADNEQEAIDYIIDFCEENLPGLLFDRDEEEEEEFLEEYICGGNHSRYLNTLNIHIKEIPGRRV